MTFKGCTCNLCKATAIGVVAGWSVVTFANHDPFCWKQKGSYCEMPWDVAHGPHNDQPIHWIKSPPTVIASTSSTSSDGGTTPDFFIRWT